jgi:hypothetical protein
MTALEKADISYTQGLDEGTVGQIGWPDPWGAKPGRFYLTRGIFSHY